MFWYMVSTLLSVPSPSRILFAGRLSRTLGVEISVVLKTLVSGFVPFFATWASSAVT